MAYRHFIAVAGAMALIAAGAWSPPTSGSQYNSDESIEKGLALERAGDLGAAETNLLKAASVDRLYAPRWTLAGFYFRRQNAVRFWYWSREAFAIGERDLGGLFDLCWRMTNDARQIWSVVMPGTRSAWGEYLFYLMTSGRWPAASSVAENLSSSGRADDAAILRNYCDGAIANGDFAGAMAVWRGLSQHGLLGVEAAGLLWNGNFRTEPSGRGFDWRAPNVAGVTRSFRNGEANFVFSGYEAEKISLMEQPLWLEAGKNYRLKFEYRTEKLDAHSGIAWMAGSAQSAVGSGDGWSHAEFSFPGEARSITLGYQRLPGYTNAEGSIWLRKLSIEGE